EVAGTTRDVVEEDVNLGGIPVRAADTAGLRETEDRIEALGVERTRERLASADLVVWVLDAAVGLTEADRALGSELAGRRVVLVGNKQDLGNRLQGPDWETWVESVGPVAAPAPVSCRTEAGIVGLRATLAQALLGGSVAPESILVSNVRHEARLRSAEAALDRAITAAREGFDQAAISLDLRLAVQALGEITGTAVTEETIHRIFARFCIGK
ncbi:MAG: GTP-binding protein, partial [Armatimonadetes bacterium]|nr:GTP-binding protein [Armatimonadota bacterium]